MGQSQLPIESELNLLQQMHPICSDAGRALTILSIPRINYEVQLTIRTDHFE